MKFSEGEAEHAAVEGLSELGYAVALRGRFYLAPRPGTGNGQAVNAPWT